MFVAPGEGAGGVKARAADTGGRLGVVETEIPAGHGPPLHVHRQEDEAFYVLSGKVDVVCGEDRHRAQEEAFADSDRFAEVLREHRVEVVGPPIE